MQVGSEQAPNFRIICVRILWILWYYHGYIIGGTRAVDSALTIDFLLSVISLPSILCPLSTFTIYPNYH